MSILHYCPKRGCEQLIDISKRYCDKHTKSKADDIKQYDRDRGTSTQRGYDSTWAKVRLIKLARDPLCEDCLKLNPPVIEPAYEAHHIVKIKDDSSKRLDIDNLLSLCKTHHSMRTFKGE